MRFRIVLAVLLLPFSCKVALGAKLAPLNAPEKIVARRCKSCHAWAEQTEAVHALKSAIAARLRRKDEHILGHLNPRETECLGAFVGFADFEAPGRRRAVKPSPVPSSRPKPKVEKVRKLTLKDFERYQPLDPFAQGVGPFTPDDLGGDCPLPPSDEPDCKECESPGTISGQTAQALKLVKVHCGRCHAWATRPNLVLRERARILPRIEQSHEIRHISRERREFIYRALLPR